VFEGIIGAQNSCYRDHQLAVAHRWHIKARTQMSSESLQAFEAVVEHLDHQGLVGLPTYFIQNEAAFAFIS
jgi:hypothetical protein